jgi:hypothetical protein
MALGFGGFIGEDVNENVTTYDGRVDDESQMMAKVHMAFSQVG